LLAQVNRSRCDARAEDRSNAITLGALGMLSGAFAWGLLFVNEESGLDFGFSWRWFIFGPVTIYPGLVFGLAMGALLYRRHKIDGPNGLGYLLAAGLAYFCAAHVAFHFLVSAFPPVWDDPDPIAYAVCGIPAELVGSFLLGLATLHLLRIPARLVLLRPVVAAGLAGVLFALYPIGKPWGALAFFVLWQGAYAATLSPLLARADEVIE
jgi:hypothetical protein